MSNNINLHDFTCNANISFNFTDEMTCAVHRLKDGRAAEAELRRLSESMGRKLLDHPLLRHNMVVFRGGDGAPQVMPQLGDTPPEAGLNLVIHLLRRGDVAEAYRLVKDLEPHQPQEYICKVLLQPMVMM